MAGINTSSGVKLEALPSGLAKVHVTDISARVELSWDRYMRLSASARAIRDLHKSPDSIKILDVGGFDGAIALFLPDYTVDVFDPATTSGDLSSLDARSYAVVAAVDVVEHVEPRQRSIFLAQLARLSDYACVLNYPIPASSTAQKIVAGITGDPFVGEHVKYGLPYTATMTRQFEDLGFDCKVFQHTSRSVWTVYMSLRHHSPEDAGLISRYLIEDHEHDTPVDPLYETLTAFRK